MLPLMHNKLTHVSSLHVDCTLLEGEDSIPLIFIQATMKRLFPSFSLSSKYCFPFSKSHSVEVKGWNEVGEGRELRVGVACLLLLQTLLALY